MTAFSMKQAALTDCLPQQEQYGSGCRSLKTQIIIGNIFYNIYKKLKAWLVNFWGIFGRTGVLSNLWQNYTASPINYGDGGSLPRSKNNISLLLQHYCSYSCWPPAMCCPHLELLPHNRTEELNERIKQKTLWCRKGGGGTGGKVWKQIMGKTLFDASNMWHKRFKRTNRSFEVTNE